MNRIITTLFTLFIIQLLVVKKTYSNEGEVKDCFENLNRATFALYMGLDKVIFKPLAKGYRMFPKPIRSGTSNVLSNLTNVVTIPNNILQGQIGSAGINSARLVINSTLGIAGVFDVASYYGINKLDKDSYEAGIYIQWEREIMSYFYSKYIPLYRVQTEFSKAHLNIDEL